MRKTLLALATTVAVAIALIPAHPAQAATVSVRDARGDLVVTDYDGKIKGTSDRAEGDIVRTTIKHEGKEVVVTLHFRSLVRRGQFRGDVVRIVTNDGVRRYVETYAGPNFWKGESRLIRANGNETNCHVEHNMRYARDLVRIRVPRSCLGRPNSVRVGAGSFWATKKLIYLDDGQRNGRVGGDLRLSDPVRRG